MPSDTIADELDKAKVKIRAAWETKDGASEINCLEAVEHLYNVVDGIVAALQAEPGTRIDYGAAPAPRNAAAAIPHWKLR